MPSSNDPREMSFSIVKGGKNSRKRSAESSLKELATKKQKTKEDEVSAIAAHAIVLSLQQLRIKVAQELALLKELYEKLREHMKKSGVRHSKLEEDDSDLTGEELEELLAMSGELSPKLQEMLDQYHVMKQQVEALDKQIKDTEQQIQQQQDQQQEIENVIEDNQQKQLQLKKEAVADVQKELANRMTNVPSQEKLEEIYSTDIQEDELNDIPHDVRDAIASSMREHHPSLSLVPTLTFAGNKAENEEEMEQDDMQQDSLMQTPNALIMRHVPKTSNAIHKLLELLALERQAAMTDMHSMIGIMVRAELQLKVTAVAIANGNQQLFYLNSQARMTQQTLAMLHGKHDKLSNEMNEFGHSIEQYSREHSLSRTPRLTPRGFN